MQYTYNSFYTQTQWHEKHHINRKCCTYYRKYQDLIESICLCIYNNVCIHNKFQTSTFSHIKYIYTMYNYNTLYHQMKNKLFDVTIAKMRMFELWNEASHIPSNNDEVMNSSEKFSFVFKALLRVSVSFFSFVQFSIEENTLALDRLCIMFISSCIKYTHAHI